MATLPIDSFHKGITDKYLDGDPAAARKLDNLVIDENGKLIQRDGITIYNSSAPQIPAGNQRIDSLYYFDSTLFVKSGTRLYYIQDGDVAWSTLDGPSATYHAFADSEVGAKASWSEWKGHLFITPGPSTNIKTGCRTVKVFRNASSAWTLVQAGMPGVRSKATIDETGFASLTASSQNFLYTHYAIFVRSYVAKVNGVDTVFRDYGGDPYVVQQEGIRFESGNSQETTISALNFALKSGENYDTSNWYVFLYRTKADGKEASLSQVQAFSTLTAFTATVSGTVGGVLTFSLANAELFVVGQKAWIDDNNSPAAYYYVIDIDYTTGQVTFSLTKGGVAADLSAYTTAQGATAAIRLNDDRYDDDLDTCLCTFGASQDVTGGTMVFPMADARFFYVDQKASLEDASTTAADYYVTAVNYATGAVTFSTTRGGADANLAALTRADGARATIGVPEQIYPGATEGFYNDEVLPAYFTTIDDSYGWFAGVRELRTGMRGTRVIQSKPADIDTCPGGNYVDVPGVKLTAFGMAGQHPVAFIRNAHYRIEGRYDAFGGGGLRAVLVSETEGAVSQDVIKTPDGILFASENGWCFTDGFKCINLSKMHLKATYAALSTKSRMSACYDSKNGRAYFGVESSTLVPTVSSKNNAAFVLDLFKTPGAEGVFTTMSAEENFQPNALHYDSANSRVLIGDQRGYVFKLDSSLTTDPVVNTATAWSTWVKKAVIWDYITCAFALGSSRISKWMGEITAIAKNLTGNISIDLWSYKDDRSTGVEIKAVRERSITSGLHKIYRRFPKGNLSCIYAQLQLRKGFVVIARSDDYVQATFSGAGNTAQLLSGTWPNDGTDTLIGHYLYPAIAGAYTTGWQISAQSGDTLTVLDPGNTLPTGAAKWIVKGYPKNESLELHGLNIDYEPLGEGYPERSDQGGNA